MIEHSASFRADISLDKRGHAERFQIDKGATRRHADRHAGEMVEGPSTAFTVKSPDQRIKIWGYYRDH